MTAEGSQWLETASGVRFPVPGPPEPEHIRIDDIAHALALLCRFGGHTGAPGPDGGRVPVHYSVAEHSVLVSTLVPEDLALEALLHDAVEAYWSDWVRPIKRLSAMGVANALADRCAMRLEIHFNVTRLRWDERVVQEVKRADYLAACLEARQLLPSQGAGWHEWPGEGELPATRLPCWGPADAKLHFLLRYDELVGRRNSTNGG